MIIEAIIVNQKGRKLTYYNPAPIFSKAWINKKNEEFLRENGNQYKIISCVSEE